MSNRKWNPESENQWKYEENRTDNNENIELMKTHGSIVGKKKGNGTK